MLYVCVRDVMDVVFYVRVVTRGAVAMSVSFCLPHFVAMSAFIICSSLCACTEML